MSTLSREQVEAVAMQATRKEICDEARRHYEEISDKACHWSSTIGHALDAYEREPDLRAQVARLTEALMAVEWSDGQSQVCQWCKSDIYEGHRMNCLRQQVLREQVTP